MAELNWKLLVSYAKSLFGHYINAGNTEVELH